MIKQLLSFSGTFKPQLQTLVFQNPSLMASEYLRVFKTAIEIKADEIANFIPNIQF
jgi:hypothetical protein